MAAHQDHCGTFVVDPYDIEADCCMHVGNPVRPHETVVADLELTNHEESTVEGVINYALTDAESGKIIDRLPGHTVDFKLEPGESQHYDLEFLPNEASVIHTRIQEYDDSFVGSIWYALEDVRSPGEEKTHSGGASVPPNDPMGL